MTILTLIDYCYRDAANHKISHQIIIEGEIHYRDIKPHLDRGSYFIPSQVGLEDLQPHMSDFPNPDLDHVWHTLSWVSQNFPDSMGQSPNAEITANELKANFRRVVWDENAAIKKLGMGT